MNHETAVWLNRFGLIFGFASFWFAAPEFIGDKRLRDWEIALAHAVPTTATLIERLGKLLAGPAATFWEMLGGGRTRKTVFTILTIGITYLSVHVMVKFLFPSYDDWSLLFMVTLGVLLMAIAAWSRPLLKKLVPILANDPNVRQRSLLIGAILFSISFALELLSTI